MSLLSKPTELRQQVLDKKEDNKRGDVLTLALFNHIEAISSEDYFDVPSVERLVLKEMEFAVSKIGKPKPYPKDLPRFSPSSSDKCERELYFKDNRATKDVKTTHAFQNRWTRNSSACHGATQKMLLEAEVILKNPDFMVVRLENGLPAWEKNIENFKVITHKGVTFVLFGMCDGILEYKDGTKIGFEYKTKSNSVAQIKQVKDVNQYKQQLIAYSILFDVDEWLVTVESVAKDKWSTNENARPDFKVFYEKITDRDKKLLLDKWARVAENVETGEIPNPNYSKCIFCQFKGICSEVEANEY